MKKRREGKRGMGRDDLENFLPLVNCRKVALWTVTIDHSKMKLISRNVVVVVHLHLHAHGFLRLLIDSTIGLDTKPSHHGQSLLTDRYADQDISFGMVPSIGGKVGKRLY